MPIYSAILVKLGHSKKVKIVSLSLLILCSCIYNKEDIKVDQAVEILCPNAPRTLALHVSKEDLRKALRKQYSHDGTVDTVLKLPDGSNLMVPGVRPANFNECLIRSLPKVVIPSSMGY